MMFEIVGIESINFTSRQTGDQITGTIFSFIIPRKQPSRLTGCQN